MKRLIVCLLAASLFTSCYNSKKIERSYQMFQSGLDSLGTFEYKELKLKEGDNLLIQVYTLASTNQEQVMVFNLQGSGGKAGTYTVSNLGEIELPKLGRTKVTGITCSQLKEKLKMEWSKYIKDIVIDVQMQGFNVNVLGEVKVPGVKNFKTERANIIDLISAAGGLADEGKREDLLLVREDSGRRKSYHIDLRDADVYKSPVFQLQQNDMVYVGASTRKFRAIGVSGIQQDFAPITTAVTLLGFALNTVALIVAISRN